jgi:hypothetical protein
MSKAERKEKKQAKDSGERSFVELESRGSLRETKSLAMYPNT